MSPADIAKLPTEVYRAKHDHRHYGHLGDDDITDPDVREAEVWNAAVRVCARMLDRAGHNASATIIRCQLREIP